MRTGYDLIVVGHNLTDLATAALASKQGLKTLLIEIDGRDSPTALEGAPPLPFAADSLIDVQSLREILSILEIESPLTVRRPILQVLFPDRRIDIASDRFPLEAEMEREFGQSPSLAALYDSARELSELIMERWQNIASPKNGTPRSFRRSLLPLSIAIKRRQFKELMRKASADSHIRSFLAAQVIENTRFIPAASDPLASALGVAIPFLEIGEITAGTVQLRDILLQNIETNNGAVLRECTKVSLSGSSEIVVQGSFEEADDALYTGNFVYIGEIARKNIATSLLLNGQAVHRKYFGNCCLYPLIIRSVLNENILPERLAPRAVIINDAEKPPQNGNYIFLSSHPHAEKDGSRMLTVSLLMEEFPECWTPDMIARLVRSTFLQMSHFFPFLNGITPAIDFPRILEESLTEGKRHCRVSMKGMGAFRSFLSHPFFVSNGGCLIGGMECFSGLIWGNTFLKGPAVVKWVKERKKYV